MRKFWVLSAFVLIVGLAATLHLYFINDGSGPTLFWNADEAYLFIEGGRLGYRVSYLRFPLVVAEQYLGGVPEPDEKNNYVLIVEITPETFREFYLENTVFSLIGSGPMGQFIYGGSNRGLVKWTGAKFEPATPEESQKLRKINFPFNFDNINGWSGRGGLPHDGKTVIEIGGKPVTLLSASSGQWHQEVSFYLLRPDRGPERLWDGGYRRRWVSKAEYDRVFGKR